MALDSFKAFKVRHGYVASWPPTVNEIMEYIAFLSLNKHASTTVRSYISAIPYQCKIGNMEDTTQQFIVKKMLTGLNRLDVRRDIRMPITREILLKIVTALTTVCSSHFEAVMFTSLFTLAFYGFF